MKLFPCLSQASACLLLSAGLVFGGPFAFAKGGDISGGGSVVKVNEASVLLDLYLANGASYLPSSRGMTLPETKSLKSIGVDRLNKLEFEVVQEALRRVARWEKTSPEVTGLVKEALTRAPLYFTKFRIAIKDDHYWIPAELKDRVDTSAITTVAYYSKTLGILVSKPDFDELDLDNQIATMVHESLRHVQIQYGFDLSDASVQKITAALVTRAPRANESLDSSEYVDGELLGSIERPKRRSQKIASLVDRVCQAAHPYRSVMIAMDQDHFDRVCVQRTALALIDLSIQFRNIASGIPQFVDGHSTRDAFLTILNAASEANTMSVGDVISKAAPAVRELTDATVDARHAMGVDAAIDEANRGIGWLTGSKNQIREALSELVQAGVLKK